MKILFLILFLMPNIAMAQFCGGPFSQGCGSTSGGGGSGTVASGTTNQEAVYSGSTTVGSGIITDNGTNVGIGSPNPQNTLDVQGTIRSTSFISSGNLINYGGLSTPTVKNAVTSFNASGSIATTTGTIAANSNSLSITSATGWSVGMGIAINDAGAGGTAQLITSITAISGTTFTLAASANASAPGTSQTVYHDDTVALNACVNSGVNCYIPTGNYDITSAIIQNGTQIGVRIYGDLPVNNLTYTTPIPTVTGGTVIWNRGSTNDIFDINTSYADLSGIALNQDATVTPTAGCGVGVSDNSTGIHVRTPRVHDLVFGGVWSAVCLSGTVVQPWVYDLWGYLLDAGITVNMAATYNVDMFNVNLNPVSAGVGTTSGIGLHVMSADESSYINTTFAGWFTNVVIDDSGTGSQAIQQRFIGGSNEDSSSSSKGMIISSSGTNSVRVSLTNYEFGDPTTGLEVDNNANVNVNDCTISGNGTGIEITSTAGQDSITGNKFTNDTVGVDISTAGVNNVYLAGNTYTLVTTPLKNTSNNNTNIFNFDGLATGNIGIGSWNPQSSLDVNGTLGMLGSGVRFLSGNVGIGLPTPSQALDVQGTVRATGFTMRNNPTTGYVLTALDSSGDATWSASGGSSSNWTNSGANVYLANGTVGINTNSPYPGAQLDTEGTVIIQGVIPSSEFQGYLGIGTATPQAIIDVWGNANVGLLRLYQNGSASTSGGGSIAGVSDAGSTMLPGDRLTSLVGEGAVNSTHTIGVGASIDLDVEGTVSGWSSGNSAGAFVVKTTPLNSGTRLERIRVNNQGNLGIGTTSPNALFDVWGTVDRFNIASGGNVGIGTASPGVLLDVNGTVRAGLFSGGSNCFYYCNGGADVGVLSRGSSCLCPSGTCIATNVCSN